MVDNDHKLTVGLNDPNMKRIVDWRVQSKVCARRWYQCHNGFSTEKSWNAARVSLFICSTHYLASAPQCERFFPNMLTQSVGQKADSVTLSHTHAHLNASQGCGIQFSKPCLDGLWGLFTIHLHCSSHNSFTLTRILYHMFTRLWLIMTMNI